MNLILTIYIIAILVSISCSILGVFLVLKKISMLTDAISHTILLGIIISFFIVKKIDSPLLIVGASIFALMTVYLVELISNIRLIKEDSAIGIVMSFLFSIAVILVSKYTANTHLDVDSVLLGEIVFAPFHTKTIFGLEIPYSVITGIMVLCLNLTFIVLFFKEIKISIFDRVLASSLGLFPIFIHYSLMTLVSITAITSFEAIGVTLMVSFMVGPASTAYLISKSLKAMICWSIFFGILSTLIGVRLAFEFDISISGAISVVIGMIFLIVFFISKKGTKLI
ncbi:metal ABC transporter permease [Fusobacterium gastrosuis]|uniref:metal ABC transporter permease n=1 Tax=Fusobacterium gastrosuis TaxID=1755100 RepID=UPI001F4FF349|nr:metal ABC transporter permease [Fusobacterium gastrosuis]MDY5306050.1 metal ABC transporter permease [Fusobacterium gastrosuis]